MNRKLKQKWDSERMLCGYERRGERQQTSQEARWLVGTEAVPCLLISKDERIPVLIRETWTPRSLLGIKVPCWDRNDSRTVGESQRYFILCTGVGDQPQDSPASQQSFCWHKIERFCFQIKVIFISCCCSQLWLPNCPACLSTSVLGTPANICSIMVH